MIYLTEKAAKKVEEISNGEGIGHYCIRIKVLGGGCAGFSHDLYFDEIITDMDEVFELDGVKVIVDALSYQYLDGAWIDYLETEFGGGFKINSPNAKGTCGCGSSVSY